MDEIGQTITGLSIGGKAQLREQNLCHPVITVTLPLSSGKEHQGYSDAPDKYKEGSGNKPGCVEERRQEKGRKKENIIGEPGKYPQLGSQIFLKAEGSMVSFLLIPILYLQ